MSKNLIIVESPNKINTIKSYLGNDYEVVASYGHLRELNKKKGFVEGTFEPIWEIVDAKTKKSKKPIIDKIIDLSKSAENIYLASDPDREGEAIAWHIYDLLPAKIKPRCKRITFNEVTKNAILESIKNEHDIDYNLVHSQFTRRILDRIIGYKLSQFTKHSMSALSAGRVQSIALLFVVERELERRAFVPKFWWEINAVIDNNIKIDFIDLKKQFESYPETNHNSIPFRFNKEDEANKVYTSLSDTFTLKMISENKISYNDAVKPLTTDKLLQLASSQLGWNTSKTTLVAQKMFEGISFNNQIIGLISYPRTDSERLNDEFINSTKTFIKNHYGDQYIADLVVSKNKSKVAIQDAHEAIRPVSISLTPSNLASDSSVSKDVVKLYELIWTRTISSLMLPPSFNNNNLIFDNNGYEFAYSHKMLIFDGYWCLDFYKNLKLQYLNTLPNLKIGNSYKTNDIILNKHEKQPPAYYTEATLIAALKEAGVGRPSTYSTMARIGEARGYITKDKQKLIPNELGMQVIEYLTKYFSNVIDKKFTAHMELELDDIASGKLDWKEPLVKFYSDFIDKVAKAYQQVDKKTYEKTGELCPNCNSELVFKLSRYGSKFIACNNFPTCKYTKSLLEDEPLDEKCPECNKQLLIKQNKKKQKFIGCSGFPSCRFVKSYKK